MECNKDEAIRAKEISESKFVEKDVAGARKFAQKAARLFPGLEGLSQLLRILDVYISAEKKINGESDWYSVLGVDPTADDETIKKNYRQLALSLHPDKNKSVGAEGAFKLVSEAWTVLSDKVQRKAYDQKHNLRDVYQKVFTQNASSPAGQNGHHEKSSSTTQSTQPAASPPNPNTFWTQCPTCLMHFEYLKVYLNQKILCPNCREPFWAIAVSYPHRNHPETVLPLQRQNHNANHHLNVHQGPSLNPSTMNYVNVRQGPSLNSSTMNYVNVHHGRSLDASSAKGSGKLKRGLEAQVGAVKFQASNPGFGSGKGDGFVKKRRVEEHSSMVHGSNAYAKVNSGVDRVYISRQSKHNFRTRELSQAETRSMLMTKARKEIHKKVGEWSAAKASMKEGNENVGKIQKHDSGKENAKEVKVNSVRKDGDVKIPSKSTMKADSMDSDVKDAEAMLMNVPDPDFHDFDKDRTEKSFGENQIWAAYDEDDGMPRYYAMIHSVISKRPFKMRISWLNSKSNAELGPISWVASGFPKTSGDFRIGKHEVNTSLNSFSHRVQWTKEKKGIIRIFPHKGDVWALYRNWSPDWNEFTPDDVIHKYDMVIAVEDFNEEKGVMVAPLSKVAGFKSVFHQHSDAAEAWVIPREEIFRFSHQVPSFLLTGDEACNAPKGCWELDPAALPLELLQTTIEAKLNAEENKNGGEESLVVGNSKRAKDKVLLTYARKSVSKSAKAKDKETEVANKSNEETKVGASIGR